MYASNTKVDPTKSRQEIESMLMKRKASKLGVGMDLAAGRATVQFQIAKNVVAFAVKMPMRSDFLKDRNGWTRTESRIDDDWNKAVRQRWRALLMVLKGKFAAIDAGVETFEQAFFYHLQVPSGGTVGEHVAPRYQASMENPLTPLLGAGR